MGVEFDLSGLEEDDVYVGQGKGFASSDGDLHGAAQIKIDEIVFALEHDARFLIDFFLHEHLSLEIPEFHVNLFNSMTAIHIEQFAAAAPRGHAKTTLAKLAAIWYWLFTPFRFILYASNTHGIAAKAVMDIINFLRSENFRAVFGAPVFKVEREGDGEFQFWINDPKNPGKKKFCIIVARGANQQVRGLNIDNIRPELGICDDIEDREKLTNEDLVIEFKTWFWGTFMKAFSFNRKKIIFIGNMVGNNCLLKDLIDSPKWTSVRFGCILQDGTPLWGDMFPLQKLMEDYREYKRLGKDNVWFAEMMNLIVSGTNGLIAAEEIHYVDNALPDEAVHGFITIDPATGDGKDDTAIAVHLLVPVDTYNYLPVVVDYDFGKYGDEEAYRVAKGFCFKWGVSLIGIESIGFQRSWKTVFDLLLANDALSHVIEVVKIQPSNTAKVQRLVGWAGLLKIETKAYAIVFGEMHITTQLLAYDKSKDDNTDDLIDSCAQGPKMLEQFLPQIMSRKLGKVLHNKPVREAVFA